MAGNAWLAGAMGLVQLSCHGRNRYWSLPFFMRKEDLILVNLYCITLRLGQILEPRTITNVAVKVKTPRNTPQDWDRYNLIEEEEFTGFVK